MPNSYAPTVSEPVPLPPSHSNTPTADSPTSASSSQSSLHDRRKSESQSPGSHLERPALGLRKTSGTIIVPRDYPHIEIKEGEETFDEDDARAMSPRRNSEDVEKMSQDAREELSQSVFLKPRTVRSTLIVQPRHDKEYVSNYSIN